MRHALAIAALILTSLLLLQETGLAHGGAYNPPPPLDPTGPVMAPAPPAGGTNSGPADTAPTSPAPSAPSAPSGAPPTRPTPSTPGPAAPSSPRAPAAGPGPGGGPAPSTPRTPRIGNLGPDLTNWQVWWQFNKAPYLNLRAKIHQGASRTASGQLYLGVGQDDEFEIDLGPSEAVIRRQIVPALISTLGSETNNDILTGALIALAKIGDSENATGHSEFEAVFTRFLRDSVQEVRETAAISIGILANPDSIEKLEHLALDDVDGRRLVGRSTEVNFRTRAFAIYGLGLIGGQAGPEDKRRIVRTLSDIIEDRKMSTRDVKVAAIIAMGLVPIENIRTTAGERTQGNKHGPSLSRTEQITYLLKFLKNERENHYLVRAHAPRSIALLLNGAPEKLRKQAAHPLLKLTGKSARSEKRELRQSATLALGMIGNCSGEGVDAKIHEALLEAYSDPDQQTKFFSLIALAQATGRPGPWSGDNGPYDQEILAATRAHLAKKMATGKRAKEWAALSIGVLGHALSVNAIQPMSLDLSNNIRYATSKVTNPLNIGAYTLSSGLRGDAEAISGLMTKLSQISDDEGRGQIAVSLGLLGARGSIDHIQAIIKKSKYRPALLKQAAIGLGLLGDKSTVLDLIEMLREAKSLASQASISQALGFIGDARAVSPLIELLKDQQVTARARAFAAVALGSVADKELLPWNSRVSMDINYRANTPTLTNMGGTGLIDIL